MAPEQRRAAIIEASLPLVLEHGLSVTTRQLADAAGVAEGTLFRVFADKEALVWAVVGEAMDPEPTLHGIKMIDRALPLRERLEACVEIQRERLLGVFNLLDALRINGPPPEHVKPHNHRDHDEINNEFRAAMVDLIGADDDQLRSSAIELAHVMRLLAFSATHPRISDGHPLSARQIVSVLLDGMASRHGAPPWDPELPPPPPPED